MRFLTLVLVFALLAVCVSAVAVPYKWCGSSSDDATVDSIVSNEFPPNKGDTLQLNVTGNLSKEVTAGTYAIAIVVDGIVPLPTENGSISEFRDLPWPVGQLNFSYSRVIPTGAPSGSYVVRISAIDQDWTEIFCISVSFPLKKQDGLWAKLQSLHDEIKQPQDDKQQQQKQQTAEQIAIPLSPAAMPKAAHKHEMAASERQKKEV